MLGDELFYTDSDLSIDDSDLDAYIFKSHQGSITGEPGYLEFWIDIDRYCGPVDDEGYLINEELLNNMGAFVILTMSVYDIDNKYDMDKDSACSDTAYEPEKHKIYINEHESEEDLFPPYYGEDGDGKWIKYESIEVPLHYLKFPEKGVRDNGITPARNLIRIKLDVDNANLPYDVWAVAVDWAYFRLYNFPRPIVFIHGKGDNSLSWKIYDDDGRANIDSGGWYKWFEDKGFVVGAVDVWGEGDPFLVMKDISVPTGEDFLDNNGIEGSYPFAGITLPITTRIDEEGETNLPHWTNKEWHDIPDENYFCFSDMLDTNKTNMHNTHWLNMTGMKRIGTMFGTKMVHFVSHSTGCFYGRKYISEVMSDTKYKHNDGYADYPLVDKFIMLSGLNNGVNLGDKLVQALLWGSLCEKTNIFRLSPVQIFYKDNKCTEFNKQKENKNVKYYTIGGYSGWRSENIPCPIRPYWDINDWVGILTYDSCIQEDSIESYKHLGGIVGVDTADENYTQKITIPTLCGHEFYMSVCVLSAEKKHVPNDCLCTLASMRIKRKRSLTDITKNLANFPLNHHHTRTDPRIRQIIYEELLPMKTEYSPKMEKGIKSSSEVSLKEQFISLSQPNIPEHPIQYTSLTGTINPSETKNEELILLGEDVSIYFIWDPTIGDLDLQATNPEGEVIDNDRVQKMPGIIRIDPSPFIGGLWNFRIISSDLTQPLDYKFTVYMNTYDLQINPSTTKYDYLVGEWATVFAEVSSGTGPIPNAEVTANIYALEDNTLLGQITLYDNGTYGDANADDGLYTNNEWIPDERGKEKFEITASFSLEGEGVYTQSTQIIINVIDGRVTFNNSGSDQGIDENENGKYDLLRLNIDLTSSVTGDCTFSAELYDPNDYFISSAHEKLTLVEGTNTVELDFSGKDIFNLALTGPYYLKNAIVLSEEGELMALSEAIYSTGSYDYTDFEGPAISFSATQAVEGVDDDSDGKFNYLKWDFNLVVACSGTYNISASLKSQKGQIIERISNNLELIQGENLRSLYFDGSKIWDNRADGPYLIGNVTITGEGRTIALGDIYTTNSFHYNDFEDYKNGEVAIMNLPGGWSMISLPVKPNDFSVSSLFPGVVVVYDYVKEQGYVRIEELEIGEGYWILVDQNQSYTLSGQYIRSYSKTVNDDRWELIGGCTSDAKISTDNCNINVIYDYEQGYGYQRVPKPEILEPGEGYWMLFKDVVDQCELTVEVIDPNIS